MILFLDYKFKFFTLASFFSFSSLNTFFFSCSYFLVFFYILTPKCQEYKIYEARVNKKKHIVIVMKIHPLSVST